MPKAFSEGIWMDSCFLSSKLGKLSSRALRTHPSPITTNLGSYKLPSWCIPAFLASSSFVASKVSPVSTTLPT